MAGCTAAGCGAPQGAGLHCPGAAAALAERGVPCSGRRLLARARVPGAGPLYT